MLHQKLRRPWRCEVNGKYDVKQNLYLFSWEGRRIAMVPPKVTPQLPKLEVKVEEKIAMVSPKRKSIKDKVRREKVTEIGKVPLAIGKHYNELVTCDVVDMRACHVFLGRLWQHDVESTSNMYLFKWSGKTIAMLPVGVVSPNKKLKSKTLVTLVASPKEFQAKRKETGVSYALVEKGVEDVMENCRIPIITS
ncbi:hypothetical protein Tco_0876935 [Tanacetum coccineum]|uniref:Uncharacterized protein n=1 Tax=Tanacetum coccineum TaxID=301880 RepID=A0ABQ5BVC6_9ASTR